MKGYASIFKKSFILFLIWNISILLVACGSKEPVLLENCTEEVSIESDTSVEQIPIEDSNLDDMFCYVYVCGAVINPGVYHIKATSRIYEAVAMAGGFSEEACTEYWNQAEQVFDGQQIKIPTREEAEEYGRKPMDSDSGKAGIQNQTDANGLININTADEKTLCTLPGIGSLKAASIIAYREKNGGFLSIEDILKVDGIKSGTYNKLKDKITV